MTGSMAALDRLYSMTAPRALELGEMAALNMKSVVLLTSPDWVNTRPGPDCFSSYQVAFDPAPPATVCWVQIPLTGSPTACVRRPSRVSIRLVEPACRAEGGAANGATVTSGFWISVPVASRCQTASLLCGIRATTLPPTS